jgi:hypothetical protein
MSIKNKYFVKSIKSDQTYDWLLNKHYAKRIPSISWAFGLFDIHLQGVCTFGKPASPSLCDGICGKENSSKVYELNRLVINDDCPKNTASYFISKCLKMLPNDLILVSYADTSMDHVGKVYQATNWIYTGLSDKRTEWREVGKGTHSKSVCEMYSLEERLNDSDRFVVIQRPRKHRYVYFTGKKYDLNYDVYDYPKGKSKRYDATYKPQVQTQLF